MPGLVIARAEAVILAYLLTGILVVQSYSPVDGEYFRSARQANR